MPGLTRTYRSLIGLTVALSLGIAALPLLAQIPEPPEPATAPLDTLPGVTADPAAAPEGDDPAVTAPPEDPAAAAVAPEADPALELRPGVDLPESVPATGIEELRQLEEIESSLTISNDRIETLKQEIADMKGDRTQQNAALIAAAQRVKAAETDVVAIEDRLGELIVQELQVRGRLDGSNASISNVLAALERVSRNPPPALIVNPTDALGSARSALLMAAILPDLQARASAVMEDLRRLTAIKAQAVEEELNLKANLNILEEEQLRIATLIAARKQGEQMATAELEAQQQDVEALAASAAELRARVADLTRQAGAVAEAAEATAAADAGQRAPRLDSDTIRLALANTGRQQPAVPFEQARGWLQLPSSGVRVIDYGAGDGFGGISNGLSIVTRAGADVVAPADGWVLYTGNYLNYGQIVILNTGQEYTVLLAGLASVTVDVGQFVLMGQPLGTMGSRTIGRTVSTSAGVASPTLYIEMRKNNEPVDPTGWWAVTENPTQSG
jgi:septal ring factor EnvC (AmiA/AmiB activator)